MKINILILFLIIFSTGVWTYFSDERIGTQEKVQEKLKNFGFKDLKGNKHQLYDYEGRIIFVHFWATWCTPCLKELPKLIALAEENPHQLSIIAMAVSDTPKDIQRFLSKIKKDIPDNFIIGLDHDKSISQNLYKTYKLPETYVITSNMLLSKKVTGANENWSSYYWKIYIQDL